ncbi:brefeldin A-inhibited guanine nucleotide-exchange protein 3 [Parasteatoda tepidariorum]|uniref:brefeldin A-inhibited guanine nucleotide-exchange protein 3 n=1 Tax=Parasteatoda tepidariorum TaxID=114398 RepID=UPI0039BCE072
MEDILAKIMKDASTNKHANIKRSCLESQELLANQHGLMRSPPFELRAKMLETLQLALESKHSKLVSDALNGFQRMIWDKSFQSVYEVDNEENWLPIQLMNAVTSLNTQSDDVQIEILKILLNMTTTHGQSLTSRSVIMLISLCSDVYSNNASSVRTAAQVTINQTLTSFCNMLQETDVGLEDQTDDSDTENGFNMLESVSEEIYPVLHCTCEKLKNIDCNRSKNGSALLLQCILSVLKNLKIDIYESEDLINFLWQELCPLLIALLGSPKTDKNIISSQKSCDVKEIGRGSGCLATAPSCLGVEAKTVYSIAVELVRLVGSVGSLRPVLESLFHRMLLYPPVQHRLEALKSIKELFSKPELLLQLAAPPLHATSDKDWISLDLDLIKIAIDSLGECCYSSDNNVCYASVSCISALLKTLEDICCGESMKVELISCINSQFKTLESSDYKGAKSERWLKTKLKSMLDDKTKRDLLRSKITILEEISTENTEHVREDDLNLKTEELQSTNESIDEKDTNELDVKETKTFNNNQITNEVTVTEAHHSLETTSSQHNLPESSSLDTDAEEIKTSHENDSHEPDGPKNISEQQTSPKRTLEYYISAETSVKSSDSCSTSSEDEVEADDVNKRGEVTDLNLNVVVDNNNESVGLQTQDIVSPVTESAEEALNYADSNSTNDLSEDLEGGDFEDELDDITDDADRLKRIPRTLLGQEDAGKEERERVEKLCLARLEFAQKERQNAQHFVNVLQSFLPELLAIRSSIEADQALQEFASKYCEDLWQSQQIMKKEQETIPSHVTILNADGIYLALYSALLLNLKLVRNNYYKEMAGEAPLTEQQFIEEVHGSGVLVYLSATWLAELFQQVLACNLLEKAGYNPASVENSALINLLSGLLFGSDDWWIKNISDIDGLGDSLPGTQQLADYRRLEKAVVNNQISPNIEAGKKFSRRILTCCWETILEVLSVLLNGTNSCGISSTLGFLLGTEGAKEEHRRTKDAIADSLDGLQRAAKLCNNLGLQSCCNSVFSQLATASCPLSEDMLFPQLSSKFEGRQFKKTLLPGRSKTLRLHSSQILSMDVLLSKGLELGSHSPDCWKYVFQCCLFVLQLENTYFSGHGSVQSSVTRSVLNTAQDTQLLNMPSCDYNSPSMPGSTSRKLDISEIIKENSSFSHTSDVLKDHKLLEAIEALSQQVDRLFEEAASRLNLSALISFLVELCAASQIQLFTQSHARVSCSGGHGSNLLLYHLGDVMLRSARGGRPLVHVMKAWSVVAPHFVEASCHKESLISKKGVSTIHDIVSALLSSNSELPHFHFNEALFKPFENLLCLELCDIDVQEQIVSSICEFVEGCTTEIRSGWRPLFGALRTVQIPSAVSNRSDSSFERDRNDHLRVVLDVFEAFLATDNVFVFAYAAVDCLLCLLKHVRGPAVELDSSNSEVMADYSNEPSVPLDMCLAALKYLEKCSDILSSMYQIPTCPVFNSAHRIHLYSEPSLVDPIIPDMDVIYFEEPDSISNSSTRSDYEHRYEDMGDLKTLNDIPGINDVPVSLASLDKYLPRKK